MIIYINGDSHSLGHDAVVQGIPCPEDDLDENWEVWHNWMESMKEKNLEVSYGNVLAKKLGAVLVCEAESGCSNDSIIDRTLKYLESNTPDFLIIGWSTWERETWYWNREPYNFTSSGSDSVHPMLKDFYKQWVIDSNKETVQHQKERDNHVKIYLLHKLLQSKNIKHLFFNTYNFFFYNVQYKEPRYNWGHYNQNYVDPYTKNQTYYFWLEQQGFKPSNTEHYHYGADAHQAWAEFLLPKVQSLLTQNG